MKPFIHLHTHTHYSLLNALPTVEELVEAAKENEMPALALTDSGNMYGAIEFYKTCKKAGIQPIIGLDAYVATRTRHDKEHGIDHRSRRLVLLAKNPVGYRNLLRLVTASYLEGFYYKPRLDRELLEKYAEGLIALIPSFSGEIRYALQNGDTDDAVRTALWYKDIFGSDSVFLEITRHPEIAGHEEMMEELVRFAKKEGMHLAAAHDTYYLKPEDRRARETMIKIQSGGTLSEESSFDDAGEDFSFIDTARANELFADLPEALENTKRIADMCTFELPLGTWHFPELSIKKGETADQALQTLAYEGLKRRGLGESAEAKKRLEYELEVIRNKGYSPYFLVVADLLRFAHEHGILTNIRGSVAGSLTTYVTGITNIDPLEFNLPFERFLNPERPSAPDIDMDFADDRRDEVIEYAKQKYGANKVAQIGTFGTMMARAAVRDVARALGKPYAEGDRLAKLIPMGSQGFPMTIDHAMELEPDLAKIYRKEDSAKEIIDLAKKIEGKVRHISVHAAGVVIAPTPLTDYTPLQLDPKGGKIITQYDMYSIDENNAGLLKFDFLGIRNLSILADAVKRVKKIHGIEVDLEHVPLDDKKTYEMLARGETMGLFQLNGSGMTKALKELKPTVIHDINVMVALYRPGPMDNINEYIARKHGQKPATYMHPKMKNFLDTTYGVLVYQDDLLMTAIEVAGYSWGEVDKFRKAVGKKIPEEMAKQHIIFVEGCQKHGGMSLDRAENLWKLFEPFQGYGFNKAHAASYGHVAYLTAYMKANYPVEYMSAVLTADSGDVEKITEIIDECKRMHLEVLPPSINESFGDFSVVPGEEKIRFGLFSIKNFGEGVAEEIIEERKQSGPYTSLVNFLSRIKARAFNKKSLEALIKCGALDQFAERGVMLKNIEHMLQYIKEQSSGTHGMQNSLFASSNIEDNLLPEAADPSSKDDMLLWEKELLGLYISGHPLDKHKEKLARRGKTIEEIKSDTMPGAQTVIGGIVAEFRTVYTKNGDKMAFAKIADFAGSIEVVFFPKLFEEQSAIIGPDRTIAIKGRYSIRNGEPSLVAEAVKEL